MHLAGSTIKIIKMTNMAVQTKAGALGLHIPLLLLARCLSIKNGLWVLIHIPKIYPKEKKKKKIANKWHAEIELN